MNPVVIGIDPSLTGSGIASSNGWCERVGLPDVTTKSLGERIVAVDYLVNQVITLVARPALVCIEVPAFSRAGGGALERGSLWWLIARRLHRDEIPVAEIFNGQRMRYATGKGAASKGAIVDAVARRWPQFETGGDDNLADAAVLAAMGADRLGVPLAPMPATHRKALEAVRWPDDALSTLQADQNGSAEHSASPEASAALTAPHPDRETWGQVGHHV